MPVGCSEQSLAAAVSVKSSELDFAGTAELAVVGIVERAEHAKNAPPTREELIADCSSD